MLEIASMRTFGSASSRRRSPKVTGLPVVLSGRMGDKNPDKSLFGALFIMGLLAVLFLVVLALVAVVGLKG